MSDGVFFILVLALEFLGPVFLIIALVWGGFALRRWFREKKSREASRGDEAFMKMEKTRSQAKWFRFFGVIAGIVVFVGGLYAGITPNVVLVLTVIAGAFFFGYSATLMARYNASFKNTIVTAELSKVFDNLKYLPDARFSDGEIKGLGFFTSTDAIGGNDMIEADYKSKNATAIHFAQSDLSVAEKYTETVEDKDGRTREVERFRDIFRGRMMRFDFARPFRGEVLVLSKNFSGGRAAKNWQSAETELDAFNRRFLTYAADSVDSMSALTPQMIEGIFYLDAFGLRFQGTAHVRVRQPQRRGIRRERQKDAPCHAHDDGRGRQKTRGRDKSRIRRDEGRGADGPYDDVRLFAQEG
jgi:hypothetical protein